MTIEDELADRTYTELLMIEDDILLKRELDPPTKHSYSHDRRKTKMYFLQYIQLLLVVILTVTMMMGFTVCCTDKGTGGSTDAEGLLSVVVFFGAAILSVIISLWVTKAAWTAIGPYPRIFVRSCLRYWRVSLYIVLMIAYVIFGDEIMAAAQ